MTLNKKEKLNKYIASDRNENAMDITGTYHGVQKRETIGETDT